MQKQGEDDRVVDMLLVEPRGADARRLVVGGLVGARRVDRRDDEREEEEAREGDRVDGGVDGGAEGRGPRRGRGEWKRDGRACLDDGVGEAEREADGEELGRRRDIQVDGPRGLGDEEVIDPIRHDRVHERSPVDLVVDERTSGTALADSTLAEASGLRLVGQLALEDLWRRADGLLAVAALIEPRLVRRDDDFVLDENGGLRVALEAQDEVLRRRIVGVAVPQHLADGGDVGHDDASVDRLGRSRFRRMRCRRGR